jgi:hypothetical protein
MTPCDVDYARKCYVFCRRLGNFTALHIDQLSYKSKGQVVKTFRPEGIAGINSGRARLLAGFLCAPLPKQANTVTRNELGRAESADHRGA